MTNFLSKPILSVRQLSKSYKTGVHQLPVLNEVNLDIYQGDAICFLGPSGAGKSTLLQILGTLDKATSGQVLFENQDLMNLSDDELSLFRNEKMGFVFQFHHLIHELNALENVCLPCKLMGLDEGESFEKGMQWLRFMGLESRAHHYPDQLSGGELQRVSIARSLIRDPRLLFADEPTGNLDSENSRKIQELFFELQKQLGLTLVVVTHDTEFARRFSKVYQVKDGQVSLMPTAQRII